VNFSDLGIEADLVEALASKSIIEPFPIQEQTIPIALTGQDIIGQAKQAPAKPWVLAFP
jgi:Superfamily II DNA and RNA helicases